MLRTLEERKRYTFGQALHPLQRVVPPPCPMMRLPVLALVHWHTLQSRYHPDFHSYVKPNQYKKYVECESTNFSGVVPFTLRSNSDPLACGVLSTCCLSKRRRLGLDIPMNSYTSL